MFRAFGLGFRVYMGLRLGLGVWGVQKVKDWEG